MVSFIKLTVGLINLATVRKITFTNNKYYIHCMKETIIICNETNKLDFNIVRYWIKSL
jgi:hypothetical protein